MNTILFLDTETTGVDVTKDRVVSIALIKVKGGKVTNKEYHLINPTIKIPVGATEVHGINDSDVSDKPTFKDLAEEIYGIITSDSDAYLSGYNTLSFDLPLLFYEFKRVGIEFKYWEHKQLDLFLAFKNFMPRNLEGALKFFSGKELADAHNAMSDTVACVDILKGMLSGKFDLPKDVPSLSEYSTPPTKIIDPSGKFIKDENSNIIFTFGTNYGKIAKDCPDYLKWMLNADFSEETKNICRAILKLN